MPTKDDMYLLPDGTRYHYNVLNDCWEPLTVREAFTDFSTSTSFSFRLWPEFYDFISPGYRIKKVIFNEPATIVFWEDGTKTVVKCGPNDIFDPEKGIAMCFVKKIYNNKGRYNNAFKPWVDDYYTESALKIYNNGVDIVDELKSTMEKVNNWLNGKED